MSVNAILEAAGVPAHIRPGMMIWYVRGNAVANRVVDYIELGVSASGVTHGRCAWDREYLSFDKCYPSMAAALDALDARDRKEGRR